MIVLDCYRMNAAALPSHLGAHFMFVRRGELEAHVADPSEWYCLGLVAYPTKTQIADVERQGYCSRTLPAGWERHAKALYGSAS